MATGDCRTSMAMKPRHSDSHRTRRAVRAAWLAAALAVPLSAEGQTPIHVRTFSKEYVNWNEARSKVFAFPAATTAIRSVKLTITLDCPAGGCDPWDRSATVFVKGVDDAGRPDTFEIARFITPYGRGCSWTADVTDYRKLLTGSVELGFRIETYIGAPMGWLVTLDLDFTPGEPTRQVIGIRNLWKGSPEYGNPDNPIASFFPERKELMRSHVTSAKLRFRVTGHGQGNTDNAAEFAQKLHGVLVNGTDHTHELWRADCGTNPCSPQGGSWQYARAGWCPGSTVTPWDVDLGAAGRAGATVAIRYHVEDYLNECRPVAGCQASNCIFGNCAYDGGGHTTPIYWVESQLISYTSEKPFLRGEVNGDGAVDLGDAVAILFRLFAGQAIECAKAADTNDDGALDLSDAIDLLDYLFLAGRAPRTPFTKCALDPTADTLPCAGSPVCP
jgi:peptide-N-glycosidase F-like protein